MIDKDTLAGAADPLSLEQPSPNRYVESVTTDQTIEIIDDTPAAGLKCRSPEYITYEMHARAWADVRRATAETNECQGTGRIDEITGGNQ